ncbi:hypothetical protein HZS_3428 [Henneguya salminicola]|nr:hypothetical protein HZS_3428 [Henneguya salminicola]
MDRIIYDNDKNKFILISEIKHDRTDTKKITFGLLGLDSNGKYKLEDPNSSISLDLLRAVYASQLISLDSFVLVEGHHDAGMFIVQTIGNPPIPSRDSYMFYLIFMHFRNTCILESSNESYSLNMNVTNERTSGWISLTVIERFPSLKQSKFIIVPGPNDPGLNSFIPRWVPNLFIPRDALPKSITDDIENLIFCSNPVRCNYMIKLH